MLEKETLTIKNDIGSKLSFSDFGACLKSWVVKTKDNKEIDIVLGYQNQNLYETNPLYLGSTVGRYANRIANAEFELNEKKILLDQNDGPNHLHGGRKGLSTKLWNFSKISDDKISFSINMHTLDDNYPGSVKIIVTYTINKQNELNIHYNAFSDEDTILNLTHHSYFNLNGTSEGDILDHKIKINSSMITEINSDLISTGKFLDVTNSPFDFRDFTRIGKNINSKHNQIVHAKGYDHNFVFDNKSLIHDNKMVELIGNRSSIKLYVKTDLPGMQFYTGNFLDSTYTGRNNFKLKKNLGLCLEPQYFPDSPNHSHFPSPLLKKGHEYNHNIIYGLST